MVKWCHWFPTGSILRLENAFRLCWENGSRAFERAISVSIHADMYVSARYVGDRFYSDHTMQMLSKKYQKIDY